MSNKYDYEKEQQSNLEEIAKMIKDNPIKDADIKNFYQKYLGNNSFIPTSSSSRGYHDAIYALLDFLDKHGDMTFFVNFKEGLTFTPENTQPGKKIILKNHVLNVAENVLKLPRDRRLRDGDIDIERLWYGIAALSSNIGLGYGKDYIERYNSNYCQASLAALENIPQIVNLYCFHNIRDIIRLYHIYVTRILYDTQKLFDNNRQQYSWYYGIARMLFNAEMQVRRQEVFEYATDKPFFTGDTKQTMENIVNIAKRTESDKNPYLDEIEGLRKSRDKYRGKDKIKNKIINAWNVGDQEAVKRHKNELRIFEEQFG